MIQQCTSFVHGGSLGSRFLCRNLFLFLCGLFLLPAFVFAQQRTITGKITDAKTKVNMAGVTIKAKGSVRGAIKLALKNNPVFCTDAVKDSV